ncbi:MAG TPA: alcohol dehydrogenase catalytic domain-containing protein [Actinomycetota bacterium]|nr:alcohol dehydrogenase catalytic domain-containing protein [Actinomycetota bacterium]
MTAGTMRAAFFERAGRVVVREVPVPEPGEGDVRLRVRACGICGSDVSLYKTGALAGPDTVLGHEIAAQVDLDPSGALAPGTAVTVFPARGCGTCLWCREGHWRYCLDPPQGAWGGYAEYTVYPARNLIRLPGGMDPRRAALAEPLGVALRAVELSGAKPGDLAYVSGLGPIGLLTVTGLAAAGCRIVGGDPRQERRVLAEHLGAETVIDNTTGDPVAATLALDPHGPRLAFECAGVPASLEQVLDTCGPQGVVGILGIPMAPVFLLRMTLREQRAFAISGPSIDSMRAAVDLLAERSGIDEVITGTVSLEELDETMTALAAGSGGIKVLLDPARR